MLLRVMRHCLLHIGKHTFYLKQISNKPQSTYESRIKGTGMLTSNKVKVNHIKFNVFVIVFV